ncbi:bombesin receptor subtype-3-like [Daphnia carinata]|uniref:bombesin receptor subtype-3-like n=1 Tax=Daphnia carinata TaxID=120202 RepID=UPI00257B9E81|nr:bombesin receptor subtype-3-like [Daphnia carinata]
MANRSVVTSVFHLSNSSVFDLKNASDFDAIDHDDVIRNIRVVFATFGVVLGISAIGLNAAIVVASVVKNARTPFSLQTLHLMASLAMADLILLMFGLPYDLVAAIDGYWLEGPIGCQMSAYLPEASRFAWVGTVLLALPLRWPSMMKTRKRTIVWTLLVWILSLCVVIPFALHVDCLGLFQTSGDYPTTPEAEPSLRKEEDGLCVCVFTVGQSEVVRMFGSSLLAFSLLPVIAIALISLKTRTYETQPSDMDKRNTSPRRLAVMLLAFMACTLPRYVHIVVNYSDHAPTMDGHYGLALSIMEILCCGLFYCSTLIHLVVSPHPRALLRQLCRHRPRQVYVTKN